MRIAKIGAILAGLTLMSALPAAAHHAVQAQFDLSKRITKVGTLKRIDWINPHSYFHLDVAEQDGKVTTWAFESPGPNALRRAGLSSRNLFKVGETYTAVTSPSRDGSPVGTLTSIKTPEGKTYNIAARDPAQGGR